jgi:hypothetical protein
MNATQTCNTCLFWSPNQREVEQVDGGKYECYNRTLENLKTHGTFGCNEHLGEIDTAYNVPNHCPNGTMQDPNPNPIDGPCEVLIVTYWKDFEWLEYALRSMKKYFSGFQGITIAAPRKDCLELARVGMRLAPLEVNIRLYDEVPGKGMVQHMVKMAEADLIVPPGTKYVLHTDADGIFKMPTTPEHYFWNDKPYYLIRSWASLGVPDPRHPQSKAVSDCAQWKGPTDTQLGWDTEWYTMAMNTAVLPIDFYKPYREHIAMVHKRPFEDHMLAGRNEFPQTSMDWCAMGAWAHRFMNDRFTWFNVENPETNPYPIDRKKAFWSHGGFSPAIREEIEAMIK